MAVNIDISPTILDYAGIDIPTDIQGLSLKGLIENRTKAWREYMICEHLMEHQSIPKSEGIRTNQYKFFRYIDHPEWEEFYDLKMDPQEKNNIIHNEKFSSIIKKLGNKLDRELAKLER